MSAPPHGTIKLWRMQWKIHSGKPKKHKKEYGCAHSVDRLGCIGCRSEVVLGVAAKTLFSRNYFKMRIYLLWTSRKECTLNVNSWIHVSSWAIPSSKGSDCVPFLADKGIELIPSRNFSSFCLWLWPSSLSGHILYLKISSLGINCNISKCCFSM